MPSRERFCSQLRDQLDYLGASAQLFDIGRRREAIRIATVIRVIVHNTSSSTSLLSHLNAPETKLLSTVRHICYEGETVEGSQIFYDSITGGGVTPALGRSYHKYLLPAQDWWRQILMIQSPHYHSRRSIVLDAANKDGGAHVDEELPDRYAGIINNDLYEVTLTTPDGIRTYIPQIKAPLIALRQMAYELLNSPELRILAGLDPTASAEAAE